MTNATFEPNLSGRDRLAVPDAVIAAGVGAYLDYELPGDSWERVVNGVFMAMLGELGRFDRAAFELAGRLQDSSQPSAQAPRSLPAGPADEPCA